MQSYVHAMANGKFLSTPSARRATTAGQCCGRCYAISIHALREEGDLLGVVDTATMVKISIHALREEGDLEPEEVHPHD